VVLSALAIYGLYLYRERRLSIVPATSFGKGALLFLVLVWVTMIAAVMQELPIAPHGISMVEISFFVFVSIVTAMVLGMRPHGGNGSTAGALPSDARWRLGKGHAAVWLCV